MKPKIPAGWLISVPALCLIAPSAAHAQARPSADCAAFQQAIAHSQKEMSRLWADGFMDNSAPRASERAQETANELAQVQINLTLMVQNHCPVPTAPIDPLAYVGAALQCRHDIESSTASATPPSCDTDTWKPNTGRSATTTPSGAKP